MSKHTPEQRPHWLDYQIKEVCPWCHKPFSIKGYCSAQIAIEQSKEIAALRAQVEEIKNAWHGLEQKEKEVPYNEGEFFNAFDDVSKIINAALAATGKE